MARPDDSFYFIVNFLTWLSMKMIVYFIESEIFFNMLTFLKIECILQSMACINLFGDIYSLVIEK